MHLRRCGATRVTALVAFEDGAAGAFWASAGYPRDPLIGRRPQSLKRAERYSQKSSPSSA
jgi:hypothetical protein